MSAAAAADMHLVPPPRGGVLYHVGPRPNPFRWRHPRPLDLSADPPITAGNRFDAPNGEYATLYCATKRYGALLEKLSPLRPIPDLRIRVDQALDGQPDPEHDRAPGSADFPVEIFDTLQMGIVSINPEEQFVDIDDPDTHRALEKYGGRPLLNELGVARIDRGTFLSPDRGLTRRAAHEIHELVSGIAAGLRYLSAIDGSAECWAIWDHTAPRLHSHDVEPIDARSPDVGPVVQRLGFTPIA
jgi:hypothetical protein